MAVERWIGAAVVAIALLTGCGDDGGAGDADGSAAVGDGSAAVELAVVDSRDSMDALETGRVLVEERCAVLQTADGRVLLLWPEGTTVEGDDAPVVRLPGGAEVPLDGEEHDIGGGYLNEDDPLPDRLAEIEVLAACAERVGTTDVYQVALDG